MCRCFTTRRPPRDPKLANNSEESLSFLLIGVLRFNEFEGGFWTLELNALHDELGEHVVLQGYTPPPGFTDGSRVSLRARLLKDQLGFLMAGPLVEVESIHSIE